MFLMPLERPGDAERDRVSRASAGSRASPPTQSPITGADDDHPAGGPGLALGLGTTALTATFAALRRAVGALITAARPVLPSRRMTRLSFSERISGWHCSNEVLPSSWTSLQNP